MPARHAGHLALSTLFEVVCQLRAKRNGRKDDDGGSKGNHVLYFGGPTSRNSFIFIPGDDAGLCENYELPNTRCTRDRLGGHEPLSRMDVNIYSSFRAGLVIRGCASIVQDACTTRFRVEGRTVRVGGPFYLLPRHIYGT